MKKLMLLSNISKKLSWRIKIFIRSKFWLNIFYLVENDKNIYLFSYEVGFGSLVSLQGASS